MMIWFVKRRPQWRDVCVRYIYKERRRYRRAVYIIMITIDNDMRETFQWCHKSWRTVWKYWTDFWSCIKTWLAYSSLALSCFSSSLGFQHDRVEWCFRFFKPATASVRRVQCAHQLKRVVIGHLSHTGTEWITSNYASRLIFLSISFELCCRRC